MIERSGVLPAALLGLDMDSASLPGSTKTAQVVFFQSAVYLKIELCVHAYINTVSRGRHQTKKMD